MGRRGGQGSKRYSVRGPAAAIGPRAAAVRGSPLKGGRPLNGGAHYWRATYTAPSFLKGAAGWVVCGLQPFRLCPMRKWPSARGNNRDRPNSLAHGSRSGPGQLAPSGCHDVICRSKDSTLHASLHTSRTPDRAVWAFVSGNPPSDGRCAPDRFVGDLLRTTRQGRSLWYAKALKASACWL